MGEFFRRRRKQWGVVILLLACFFMSASVRAAALIDFFDIERIKVVSDRDGLTLLLDVESSNLMGLPDFARIEWNTGTGTGKSFIQSGYDLQSRTCNGLSIGRLLWPNGAYYVLVSAAYLYFTIPLTLVSAFLLLTNPRKSTSQKIVELIPRRVA